MQYALAWQVVSAEDCPDCGQPQPESMAAGSDDAYTVTPLRCFACAAKSRIAEGFDNKAGLYFSVERKA